MDRILAMSLVGAGPGNVFGPGMSAGALESFARDAKRAKAEGNSRAAGAAAGGARSASAGTTAGSGAKCGADQRTAEKKANGVGGQDQKGRGAGVNETRFCSALDGRFCFDAGVAAPY